MYKVRRNQCVYSMSKSHRPVLMVQPESLVVFETNDCFFNQICSSSDLVEDVDFDRINPATGPVYVSGAEPGDALRIEILSIKVAEQAVTVAVPGLGLLGDRVESSQTQIVSLRNGYAFFESGVKLPIAPMIGVIGTAPAEGEIPCGTPGAHGGNMDTKDVKAGAVVYLPVFVAGGLLAMGDVHALMGDGEICGTGLECAAEITVRIGLVKQAGLELPMLESEDEIMTIGYGDTLKEAAHSAAQAMVQWVAARKDWSFNDAYMFASARMDLRVSQVVNPKMTVRMAVKKKDL